MERFRHLVKLRIALAENVRKKGVDDLNQFLADVMPARFVQEAPLGGNETHVLPNDGPAFGRRWRRRVVLRLLKIEEVGNSSSGGT